MSTITSAPPHASSPPHRTGTSTRHFGVALALALGLFASSAQAEEQEPGSEAGQAPSDNDAADAAAIPQPLKTDAEQHLTRAQIAALQSMSDEQLHALLNAEDDNKLSEEQGAIAEALGKAAFDSTLNYQTGDIPLGDGLATLHLDADFRYLNPEDAQKILVDAWGNPPGQVTLGMIVPDNVSPLHQDKGWAVIVTFAEDGYVEDDDAEDIDYDDLLEEMQNDTEAGNEGRKSAGYGSVKLVGWAEPPHYDAESNRLYWAKHLKFEGTEEDTLNYAIRVLGRKGVLELNAVASMKQLNDIKSSMKKVLPRAEFAQGERYADFNPDIDQVAAYGIGGLIAGKVLAKAGLFAGLLKVLLVLKKFLIIGAIAGAGLLAKLFGRKGKSSPEE